MSSEPCWMLARIPVARSICTPRARRRRGAAPARRSPPARRAARRGTRARAAARSRSRPWCAAAGSPRPRAALARSATMLVVRKPTRSTMTPPKNAARTIGRKLKKHREARERRAVRRDEHEPRDRELRDGVARERDRVGDVERVQRRPSRHGRRLERHYNPPRRERRSSTSPTPCASTISAATARAS